MGFFTRTAMDMLMKTTHPEINAASAGTCIPIASPAPSARISAPMANRSLPARTL